ncbi:hypothetical protein GGQ79_000376 [Ochrobactrum pecoris]|uniref:Transposase n=1 Tax=Brucella pecoris TaxID=867683 RepID=A0AB34YLB0_9HYPH|nr:hypothetical protein [Brucella pecoris]
MRGGHWPHRRAQPKIQYAKMLASIEELLCAAHGFGRKITEALAVIG